MGREQPYIIHNFYRLSMAGVFGADFLVGRIFGMPTGEAGGGMDYSRELSKMVFSSPKTTGRQIKGGPSGFVFLLEGIILFSVEKLYGKAIDTVAGIFWGKTLSFENVPQVAATVIAQDFDPATIGISYFFDSSWHFVIKTWPATATAELVFTIVERCITSPANKDTV